MNKRGMEMWQIIFIILAVICLLFLLGFYKDIYEAIVSLLEKLGGRLW